MQKAFTLDKNMWHWTCQMLPRFEYGPQHQSRRTHKPVADQYKPVIQHS
jgi:hypothetical protein